MLQWVIQRRAEVSGRCLLLHRLCCKSRKLQGHEFFVKTRNGKQSPIRINAIALSKSPVSLTLGDEVPHIFTRKPRLFRPLEFLTLGAKRLLQHNRTNSRQWTRRIYEYTPSPADPKAPQSWALHKSGVGGGHEFPNVPENKTRCGFVLERIKIGEARQPLSVCRLNLSIPIPSTLRSH